jgi:hypothetical protein
LFGRSEVLFREVGVRAIVGVTVVVLAGCGLLDPDSTTRRLEVAPYKATCYGLGPTLCLQVRAPGESTYEFLYETPLGFDFVWGAEMVILVEETEVENPPMDGSSIRRRLIEIEDVRPLPEGAVFELDVPAEVVQADGADGFLLFGGQESLQCSATGACDALNTTVAPNWVRLKLRYPESRGGPLIALASRDCGSTPFCRG